jgi:hypothetical protein
MTDHAGFGWMLLVPGLVIAGVEDNSFGFFDRMTIS